MRVNRDEVITVVWSWLRVYVAAALTYVLAGLVNDEPLAWNAVAIAGLVSLLPVVINWLNRADPRYGRGYIDPAARADIGAVPAPTDGDMG